MTKTMSAQLAALTAACTAAMLLAGCSARTPEHLAQVPLGTGGCGIASSGSGTATSSSSSGATVDPQSGPSTSPAQTGERYDPAAEEVIATESLKAWRIATAHPKATAGRV